MASDQSGVTSIVQNEFPLAYYFHCAMHCLNLSASASGKVSAMQNAENVVRKVVKMFKTKAKKTAWLKSCIKEDVSSQGERKRYLVGLCEIQFVERHLSRLVKHSKSGAETFSKVCPITVQNALKWPLQTWIFKKFPGNMPPDPLEPFLFLNLLQIDSVGKDYPSKNVKILDPFLKKLLITPQTWKIFNGVIYNYRRRGVPRNLKRRGPQFSDSISTENIGENQEKKKVFTSFVVQFTSPKIKWRPKKKRSTRPQMSWCPVSTVLLTADIGYQHIFQRGGGGGGGRPQRRPCKRLPFLYSQ